MHPTQEPAFGLDLNPAEVLRCAATYLRWHGLHRRDMFANLTQPTPAACVQGAAKMAICGGTDTAWTPTTSALFDHTIGVLADHLRNHYGLWTPDEFSDDPATLVADWNDYFVVDVDHACAALNAAAREWDRQHTGGAR